MVDAAVATGAVDPHVKRLRPLEIRQALHHANEDVLCEVFGIGGIAGEEACQPDDPLALALEEGGHDLGIAGHGARHQGGGRRLTERWPRRWRAGTGRAGTETRIIT